jgi:uncharacterized protein YbjT (DUF2867 family)
MQGTSPHDVHVTAFADNPRKMSDKSPRVAVIAGATGLVGGHCLTALLATDKFTKVAAVGRRAPAQTHAKLQFIQGAMDTLALAPLAPTDAFCALGTTIRVAGSQEAFRKVDFDIVVAFAKAAKAAGATRFVLVSSLGAAADSAVFYNRVKGEAEAAIKACGFTTTVVLRPSVLDGARPESRPGERAAIFAGRLLAPLMVGPIRKYRPIAGKRVGECMMHEALHAAAGYWVLESDTIAAS